MTLFEGKFSSAPSSAFGIIVSRFNEFITRRLLDAATDCLTRHGVRREAIDIVFCPGAFELPQAAQSLASSRKYSALICLGCVIRGETPHFEYVANAVSAGIGRVALETHTPIAFGVLTTETLEQAVNRAGAKAGNKGWDAAIAALEMADLDSRILNETSQQM
jgi:6,7-dimethyl-8-ribityllumazine synthase